MPLAKEDFAEYQRRRRSAGYACMGCGEVGAATERYKASTAAAEIRCCQECHRKITAALQPDMATPAPTTATPAPAMDGLPDTYEERIRISQGAPWPLGSAEDKQMTAIRKALSDSLETAMKEGLVKAAMNDRARELVFGVKSIKGKKARFSTAKT